MESRKGNELLTSVFVALLVMANVLSTKLLTLGPLLVPGGIICYAFTFLVADIISERYGEKAAKDAVLVGLIVQILCAMLIRIIIILPGDGTHFDKAMQSNIWFTVGGLVAYFFSQTIGIKVFHSLRNFLIEKKGEWRWLWENVSTILGQIVDTIIFVGIAYGLGLKADWETLKIVTISQIIVKTAIAVIDTPLFYLFTRRKEDGSNSD